LDGRKEGGNDSINISSDFVTSGMRMILCSKNVKISSDVT